MIETARFAGRGKRLPPPNPSPKSRPIPHGNTPSSVCLFPPSLSVSVGQILRESRLPNSRMSLPGSARAVQTLHIPTLRTFPAVSGYSTAIYSALSPSLIHPACLFKPFPLCYTVFLYFLFVLLLFFEERGIFRAAF